MKAWRYLSAAVLQRWRLPFVGEVPVNLAALGIFGVMGLDQPVFWAAGGCFEAVWLTLTAGRTAYRRQVDARDRKEIWRKVEERRLALYGQLTPDARHRHHALRAACQELSAGVHAENTPDASVELFTWLHLKLLLARETLAVGMPPGGFPDPASMVSRENLAGGTADPDLHGLRARAMLDVADPAARSTAEHAVSLLESNRHHLQESGGRLTEIDARIVLIEEEIAAAIRRHRRERTPYDFRHSLPLAGDRFREAALAAGNPLSRPVAEMDSLLADLSRLAESG